MKILIFMPSLAGGGAERTVVNLANQFSKQGNDVHLLIGQELDDDLRSSKYIGLLCKNITLRELDVPASIKSSVSVIRGIRNYVKKNGPDLVFTTRLPSNLIVLLAMVGLRRKTKVVIRESVCRSLGIKGRIARRIVGFSYNRADAVVSLSRGVASDLVDIFGVSKPKVKTIYNPVDLEFISRFNSKAKSEMPRDEIWNFIFVGRFDAQKAPIEAIWAFEEIRKNAKSTSLSMYGVGPLVPEIKRYLDLECSASNVQYFGFTEHPYLKFNQSDFFLMPSKFEGFGHVIVEALACGCIPIVYNCPHGPSEILTGDLDKLLVPVGDWRMLAQRGIELLNDQEECDRLRSVGREIVKKFDSSIISAEYLELFKDVVG